MLINIPVSVLYSWMTIVLLNTMRITFTNLTGASLRDIEILGCGGGYINQLELGQNKTVWIDIKDDCTIRIVYYLNGQKKEEIVADYVTNSNGQKMNYKIGRKNNGLI